MNPDASCIFEGVDDTRASMRIIAVMNQKGGVGKTTTTVNLAAALAAAGQHVCLIDLDPQAHATINFGIEPADDVVSMFDVLVEDKGLLETMQQVSDHITVVPASIDLAAAEVQLATVPGRESILKRRIADAGVALDFDYVLLDCPPSLGILTINALAAATELIVPMQPHFLALQGMAKLLETVQLVNQRLNPQLKVSGMVLTMYDSQLKLSAEVLNELRSFVVDGRGRGLPWSDAIIYETRIRRNIKLAESPSHGQTILQYGPTSAGANDYRALAGEVMNQFSRPAPPPTVEVSVNPNLSGLNLAVPTAEPAA